MDGFVNYFTSMFVKHRGSLVIQKINNVPCCDIDLVSEKEILKAIHRLPNKFTSGQDMISSFSIKECANAINHPLFKIFNLILKESTFIDIRKTARVCPVFKKDDKSCIEHYRPISILIISQRSWKGRYVILFIFNQNV